MFYHDKRLQYTVRVEKPNANFARLLQQAVGGVEGEIRVMMQYLFQAWNSRGPAKYRDMLLNTGTEEIGHIEMLATAIALNLEKAPNDLKDDIANSNALVGAVMGGQDPRHVLSAGLGCMAADANGVPFNGSWVVSTGNIASDMYANVHAEASGRVLATRLYEMTDDAGMKDMLSFLIARDTMHQNQWLAALEELGGVQGAVPIPNSFPAEKQAEAFAYTYVNTYIGEQDQAQGRWTNGPSIDGKGSFSQEKIRGLGDEPRLGPPHPLAHAQAEQMTGSGGKDLLEKVSGMLS